MSAEEYIKRISSPSFHGRAYRSGEKGQEGFVQIYEGKVRPKGRFAYVDEVNVIIFKLVTGPGGYANLGGAPNLVAGDPLNRNPDVDENKNRDAGVGVLAEVTAKNLEPMNPDDFKRPKGGYQGLLPHNALDLDNSYRIAPAANQN